MRRAADPLLPAGVFAGLLLFRLATADIVNDDYLHLSTAQQVVLGAMPVRDFLDPGEFLFYTTSAAAQLLHRSLLSEVLLDAIVMALGHTIVFVLASRAAQSYAIGLLATGMSALIVTRLYSYPKIFLYAAALALMWRYVDRRDGRTLAWLGVWIALAFLFRHDHGAYIGVAAAATLAFVHWADGWRIATARIARLGAIALILVLPFLVFVQVSAGGFRYWRNMIETGRGEYLRTVGEPPQFALGTGWLGDADNAIAWFYHLTILMPPLTALIVASDLYRRWRGRLGAVPRPAMPGALPKIGAAAVLATLMHLYLLRAASESAIADVSAITAVLGAWLLGRGLRPQFRARGARIAAVASTAVVLALTLSFARQLEGAGAVRRASAEVARGGNPVARKLSEFRRLSPPFDDEGAEYIFACTAETDRLLVTAGYAPRMFYMAGRGFAAGRLYFLGSLAPSPEFKALSLEWLENERVPIALVYEGDYDAFVAGYPELHAYFREHYRRVGEVEFDQAPLQVYVDERIPPLGTYGPDALPCYRARD